VDRAEAAFRTEISRVDLDRSGPDSRAQLAAALARGRAAFPRLPLDDETFARHLARAVGWIPDAATLATLVVEDLFLACACLTNVAGAANTLIALHGDVIRRTIARTVGESNSDEITQAITSDLIVGSLTSGPEIGNYAGRAPLARWLDVVARRAALRWLRAERKTAGVAELAAAERSWAALGADALSTATPPELALFRNRYGLDFQRAFQDALAKAPESNRAILRLYLVNDVSVEKIGKMLGVSQSTASRWLAKAREDVLSTLTSILKERRRISSGEIEALAHLLASRLDMSITEALADDARSGRA
jgi:RNA polymerase sigma-70 factor (ECF subfamily)